MKRKLILLMSLLLIVASCSKDVSNNGNYEEVTFTCATGTKVVNNVFEEGDNITVTAYMNSSVYAENVVYSYGSSVFSSETPISFDSTNSNLQYIAVYPQVESLSSLFTFAANTDQSSDDNYENSDLLVSKTKYTSATQPELSFEHKMSSIVITLDGASYSDATLVFKAQNTIECDMDNLTYTATGDTVEIKAASNGENGFKVVVAPQTLLSGTTFATLTVDGQTYDWTLTSDLVLEVGSQYTYTWKY